MNCIETDVVILGAGASGLMCAIVAGRRGRSVVVLYHNGVAGAKLAISGGGRCNCTNLDVRPDNYVSANPRFCASALARFSPRDFIAMLEKHGVKWHVENGSHVFCNSGAKEVVKMLCREAAEARVDVRLGRSIAKIERDDNFVVTTNEETVRAKSLVIATGGLSYSAIGATDLGHALARQFGLRVTATRPGLCGFVLGSDDAALMKLSGIAVNARGSCADTAFDGSLLFTHKGISGPLALQLSLYWTPGAELVLNFMPDKDVGKMLNAARGANRVRTVLQGHMPKRLCEALVSTAILDKPVTQCSKAVIAGLAEAVNARRITPVRTEGFAVAEVTLGGIDTREVSSKTMESRKVPGLFCIGEVLDVTGQLGGYNLHWAWASGQAAGEQV